MTAPALQMSPLFSLVDEKIAYKSSTVLDHITLKISEGETVALVGRSGSGKTSLLKRLYQLEPESCSFIHQHYALVPQLSAFHNIYMGRLDRYSTFSNLRVLIRPNERVKKDIISIATLLGLEQSLWSRTGSLSGGQQQRVGIGRALYRGGRVLMADEPVSSLDGVQAEEIIKLITGLGKTVISALHSTELSRSYFSRIIGLRDKRIHFDLPAAEVMDKTLRKLYS